jgi:hypothetical protein
MTLYVNVPIETDPDALAQDSFGFLTTKNPGWEPRDAQLDTWLLEANARMAATLRDVASDVPIAIFRYFGKLVNVLPIDAAPAGVKIVITASDAAGHTLPAGSNFGVTDPAGIVWAFSTTVDVVIPNGSTTASNVDVIAAVEGSGATNLGANGTPLTILDSIAWISTATLMSATSGGVDAEEDEDYLDRLALNLSLMAPRPILPNDFAALSRNVSGIERALAIDGYDAVAATSGNARTVTVAVVDALGQPVSSLTKTTLQSLLSSYREANFLVYVVDPTYTTIDVIWDVTMYPTFSSSDVAARVNAAVAAFLSPANWGQPPTGDKNTWYNSLNVRLNDLIIVIGREQGVDDVNSVTLRKAANPFAAADVPMTGVAPLPLPGVISGTVH